MTWSWQRTEYDAHDGIDDTPYHAAPIGLTADDPERMALDQAIADAEIPTVTQFDVDPCAVGVVLEEQPRSLVLGAGEGAPRLDR